jgi:CMP-N,N'-diacetyllegionaminic acid synthase
MEKGIKVLAIVPARGGSKGVPRKNIRPLLGKSLIQRTFEVIQQTKGIDRVILSTDDEEIAAHGKSIGLEVPFMRPDKLATDVSSMTGVILHALDTLVETENYVPDAVVLLQPTSPLRKPGHIERAIELLNGNDAVCSVLEVPQEFSPYYVMKITDKGYLDFFLEEGRTIKRRQDAPKAYLREGTVYLATVATIRTYHDLYGQSCVPMLIAKEESLSIDTEEDWEKAVDSLSLQTN